MSICLIVDYSILNYTRKLVRIFQKHCRIYMSLSENIPRVLVRPYLMTLYVILWIHLNILIRSRFVLKAIIPEKNQWIVLVLTEKVLSFSKRKIWYFYDMYFYDIVHACGIWLFFSFYYDLFLFFHVSLSIIYLFNLIQCTHFFLNIYKGFSL